jgi:hypothetical protein
MKTSENTEEDPDDPEPADEGDIQMTYCSQSIGLVTKNYL